MMTAFSEPTASRLGSAMLWALNLCTVGALSCGKVSEASPVAAAAASSPATAAAPAAGTPEVEHPNYTARMHAVGACRKDQPCAAEITVVAKGDYHINEKYPYRFKLDEPPPGVRYPKPVVGKDEGVTEGTKLTLKVPFVAETVGETRVAGTLSFSVCSAANCLMDKQPLAVAIQVD